MQRTRGQTVLAVVFGALALNGLAQVFLVLAGQSNDPPALTALQAASGLTSLAAAWGSWTVARWAPVGAVLCGLITSGMLAGLSPILDLPPDARAGLWTSAAAVLVFGLSAAWYLRRTRRIRA